MRHISRKSALKLIPVPSKPVNQVAAALGVSSHILCRWRRGHLPQGGRAGGGAVGENTGADARRARRRGTDHRRAALVLFKKAAVILGTKPSRNGARGSGTSRKPPDPPHLRARSRASFPAGARLESDPTAHLRQLITDVRTSWDGMMAAGYFIGPQLRAACFRRASA